MMKNKIIEALTILASSSNKFELLHNFHKEAADLASEHIQRTTGYGPNWMTSEFDLPKKVIEHPIYKDYKRHTELFKKYANHVPELKKEYKF